MTDRLTDAELDWLDALHAAATPGPWESNIWGDVTADPRGVSIIIACRGNQVHAEAIAAAHNALPALLAEVREYRAREAAHRAALDTLVDGGDR